MSSQICPACSAPIPELAHIGDVPVWITANGIACSEPCARRLSHAKKLEEYP